MSKKTGQVKWFNESKGTLAEGQRVEYTIQDSPRGPAAANVVAL
ncbi:cold shock domain-containing protein [Serratia marcescens]|nr:cold shock domain-containing protein [Serratia marcescens]RLO43460.1 hypothetical protein CLM68_14620 [Serratia marcescens]